MFPEYRTSKLQAKKLTFHQYENEMKFLKNFYSFRVSTRVDKKFRCNRLLTER